MPQRLTLEFIDDCITSEAFSQGNRAFLFKPFSDDQILRKVREVLDGGREEREKRNVK